MKSFASLFTGGGLADVGAIQAGFRPIWGVEINSKISEVASQNLGHRVINKSVHEVDPRTLDRPDVLWVSPPCPNFSVAKRDRGETQADIDLAVTISRFIQVLQPEKIFLENVRGYQQSESLRLLENTLFSLGYWINREVLDAADYGVPQHRHRMILRATKGGIATPLIKQKHRGWHEAIADLIPGLEEVELAEWQKKGIRFDETVLVDAHHTGRGATICSKKEPSFTVTSSVLNRPCLAPIVIENKPRKLNPRSLARLQTLPEDYQLPENPKLAGMIIGNGVPCLLSKQLLKAS